MTENCNHKEHKKYMRTLTSLLEVEDGKREMRVYCECHDYAPQTEHKYYRRIQ